MDHESEGRKGDVKVVCYSLEYVEITLLSRVNEYKCAILSNKILQFHYLSGAVDGELISYLLNRESRNRRVAS